MLTTAHNGVRDGLIVLSGGLDSTTLLYDYRDEIALAVTFDYGSKHNQREIPCAQHHCRQLGIEHLIIPLGFMGQYFRSDLLLSGGEIPLGAYNGENMQATVVPFRNGIMLSIAAGLAESRGLKRLFIANHFGDHNIYPDCRAAFAEPMAEAILQGTSNQVELAAPYTHLSKSDIVAVGMPLGLDYATTWSCYVGGETQCGECATCRERKEAFALAGVPDPTSYLQ